MEHSVSIYFIILSFGGFYADCDWPYLVKQLQFYSFQLIILTHGKPWINFQLKRMPC